MDTGAGGCPARTSIRKSCPTRRSSARSARRPGWRPRWSAWSGSTTSPVARASCRTGADPTRPPFVLCAEAAGRVAAVGEGVTGVAAGQRVGWAMAGGAHAQLAAVPAAGLVQLPAEVSDRDAAAVLLQGMTAHYLTTSTYPVREGDW